jgi:hypothetical protein
MSVPLILSVVGGIALLVGLFGGGVKAKEITVPKIDFWPRLFSSLIGLILIAMATWLSIPKKESVNGPQSSELTAVITSVPTNSAPSLVPTLETHPPVIKSVVIREDFSQGYLILYQDVNYYDLDGDAYYIDWILMSTTKPGEKAVDGQIEDSVDDQKKGATFTGTWYCSGGTYTVTIRAIVLDRAGNQSNPYEYNLNCR